MSTRFMKLIDNIKQEIKKENHLHKVSGFISVGITYFSEVRLRLLPVADKRSKKNLVVVKISERIYMRMIFWVPPCGPTGNNISKKENHLHK